MTNARGSRRRDETSPALLHPVDVAPARRYYLTAMALQAVVSPVVTTAAILFLLSVSTNVFTPIAGPVLGLTVTCYVERRYRADAWAHIARRAQDRARPDPSRWAQAVLGTQLALLIAAVSVFLGEVGREPVQEARMLGVGVLSGLAVTEAAVVIWDRQADPESRSSGAGLRWRRAQAMAVGVVVIVAVIALLMQGTFNPWAAGIGLVVLLGVSTGWYLMRLVPARSRCLPRAFPMP